MSATWDTKWGKRRVRQDPPTLAEALAAAQGLTDDGDLQIEIAATLMGVDLAEAKIEAKKLSADRRATLMIVAPTRDKGSRTIVVERRTSRRLAPREQPQREVASPATKVGLRTR